MEVSPANLCAFRLSSHLPSIQGCSSPVVVKFADTPKDKESKKIQQQFTGHNNGLMQPMSPGNAMVRASAEQVLV